MTPPMMALIALMTAMTIGSGMRRMVEAWLPTHTPDAAR